MTSGHEIQELLADALLELKLSRCKEAVSERMKSILQKKLQLAKDETLWVLDKVIKDKEEVRYQHDINFSTTIPNSKVCCTSRTVFPSGPTQGIYVFGVCRFFDFLVWR